MKRFISFSGGVESTTMCVLYGKGATAVWSDTGWEHKEMYERIEFCEKRLKEIHEGDFNLVRIKADIFAKGKMIDSLEDYIKAYRYMPSRMNRFCTKHFKIIPIDNFLKEQGDCELLIGFNADEEPGKDRTGNYMECKNVKYSYNLFEEGYTREDCQEVLSTWGLSANFPIYMQRGGCKGCLFKSRAEYKALYFFDFNTFLENRILEESIQADRKRFFTICISGESMKSIAEECEMEMSLFGRTEIESMYKKIKPSQSCGAFCHR